MSRVFVYVLPLLGDEWLKLGISADPLRRAQDFSRRYYELFDFDAAFLVETEDRRDAGRIELMLRRSLQDHRAPMPLAVRPEAGGHTEWLRGAYPALLGATQQLAAGGYPLHAPARTWFANALGVQQNVLNTWASTALSEYGIEPDAQDPGPLPLPLKALLDDVVGAFHHFGWRVGASLPPALQSWYAGLPNYGEGSFDRK